MPIVVFALAIAGLAQSSPPQEVVAEVRIHGNVATPDQDVLELAGIQVGAPLAPTMVSDVAARLRTTKRFERVEVLKRFASISDPTQIALVIIVDEGPVKIERTGDPDHPTRVVRRSRLNLLWLPVLNAEDGYGVTYGARAAFADPAGKGSRLAFPLTWGGDKRAAVELDKDLDHSAIDRLQAGASISRRTHPFFEQDEDRNRMWVRGEREVIDGLRAGVTGGWQRVSFLGQEDSFAHAGADLVLDTRQDPTLPRNAVYARVAWDHLNVQHGGTIDRSELEGRAYIGLTGQNVLVMRALRSDADGPVVRQNSIAVLPVESVTECTAGYRMLTALVVLLRSIGLMCRGYRAVALENLALRQQLAALTRTVTRPQLRTSDRLFWVLLATGWREWRTALIVVQPDTVLRWHREWLRRRWTRRSTRTRPGRPCTDVAIRALVGKMAAANPLWGAPRIHGELCKLGIAVSERTVSRLLRRPRRPPSQTWRTFLTNHLASLVSIDFFTVSTLTGRVLFVLVLLAHQRRRVVHVAITEHPTAVWTAQQIVEAFPNDTAPRWLLRDRDAIYGDVFQRRVAGMGITEVISSPSSPWQNPYAERLIGSIRRECLDHVIVLSQAHLRHVLARYVSYYHGSRTHLSLEKDAPTPRRVQAPTEGAVIELAEVGGLHHRYERRAA